jgi:hypothetical protein
MTKVGTVVLKAVVATSDDHDVARYLEELRKAFANNFSIAVHDMYPDAKIHTAVTLGYVDDAQMPTL